MLQPAGRLISKLPSPCRRPARECPFPPTAASSPPCQPLAPINVIFIINNACRDLAHAHMWHGSRRDRVYTSLWRLTLTPPIRRRGPGDSYSPHQRRARLVGGACWAMASCDWLNPPKPRDEGKRETGVDNGGRSQRLAQCGEMRLTKVRDKTRAEPRSKSCSEKTFCVC